MFLLLSMLQVMYIHLKCGNADQRGIDAITSCAATIAVCWARSHASRQMSPLSCAREEMLCGKKSYEFSVHSLFQKMLSFYSCFHMREKFRKPLNYQTNAFLNMPGRAGRVSKGYCYRLVTKRFWNKEIPDHMVPDMLVSVCFF